MTRRKRSKSRRRGNRETGAQIEIGLGGLLALLVVVGLVVVAGWRLLPRSPEVPPAGGGTAAATEVSGGEVMAEPSWPAPDDGSWITPEGIPAIGSVSAPVTIVEYGDYQCGNCREFATTVVPWLRDTWIAQGFVRLMFRDFAILGPESNRAAEAASCAGEQGRFWPYHEALFGAQADGGSDRFSADNLRSIAERLDLDGEAFAACLASGRYRDRVAASTQAAFDSGFEGTPTFVINGRSVAGSIPREDWESLFRAYQRDFAAATVGAP